MLAVSVHSQCKLCQNALSNCVLWYFIFLSFIDTAEVTLVWHWFWAELILKKLRLDLYWLTLAWRASDKAKKKSQYENSILACAAFTNTWSGSNTVWNIGECSGCACWLDTAPGSRHVALLPPGDPVSWGKFYFEAHILPFIVTWCTHPLKICTIAISDESPPTLLQQLQKLIRAQTGFPFQVSKRWCWKVAFLYISLGFSRRLWRQRLTTWYWQWCWQWHWQGPWQRKHFAGDKNWQKKDWHWSPSLSPSLPTLAAANQL